MSSNNQKIQSNPNSGIKFRSFVLFTLCAFVGGIIAAGWAITKYDLFQGTDSPIFSADNSAGNTNDSININRNSISGDIQGRDQNNAILPSVNQQANDNNGGSNVERQNENLNDQLINERVESLDNRLTRIDSQAQQVSGNVARTEALLIAFAARRAVDSGSALGYIEEQLKLKFTASNPRDVQTIIAAGSNPVRLSNLQNQVEQSSDALLSTNNDASTWEKIKKEMSELIVIRAAQTQISQPELRLERIKTALANRDVRAAIGEMEKMPGADNARKWIISARRYIAVQNALDAIEKTAILLPQNIYIPPVNSIAPQSKVPNTARQNNIDQTNINQNIAR